MIIPSIFLTLIVLHILAIVGFFVIKKINIFTILLQILFYILGGISITAGYHRLFCHRTYEASPFLQWIFAIFGSSTGQGDVIKWSKTHRTHHRNEDQLTDPYSISKGFWFAHVGWVYQTSDEETQKEINNTDASDLEKNEILVFQKKYIVLIWIITSFILPILISKIWNETVINSLFSSIIRNVFLLHCIFCVNSLAHMYGDKPFNSEIEPSENLFVSILALGEGWHNYHHTYPKDYRTSEENKYNPTTLFLDFMHSLGLVNNRYTVCEKTKNVRNSEKFNKDNYCNIDK